jgi:hypothetical protein
MKLRLVREPSPVARHDNLKAVERWKLGENRSERAAADSIGPDQSGTGVHALQDAPRGVKAIWSAVALYSFQHPTESDFP